ncbi:MAG: DUF1573 domain-containing protein [Cytophagaceae bacterium]
MISFLDLKAQNQEIFSGPVISFAEKSFDFGDIKQGSIVSHIFKFKNSGNAPLIIKDVKSTCGCTIPEFSKGPIMPGAEGEISVTFNSLGKQGINNKSVQVESNAPPVLLGIRVNVLPKK